MVDPNRPSPAKKVDEARKTASNLNDLLDEGLAHLDKLAQQKAAGRKRVFRRKKKLVR